MAERFQLAIGDIRMDFESVFPRLAEGAMDKFYAPFGSEGRAEIRLSVHCGSLPRVRAAERLFDAVTPHRWRLTRTNGHYVFEVFDTRSPHTRIQVATVDASWSAVDVYTRPSGSLRGQPAWSLVRLMQPLGELLLIHRLSRVSGLLFHGLGVIDRGKGLLFIGPSGAGKSTLANRYAQSASDVTVLSDEHVVVVKRDEKFWVYGTPWPGLHFRVCAQGAPIHRVHILEHDSTNRLRPEHPATLCALLAQQMFLPFWSQEAVTTSLRVAEELVEAIPTYRLGLVNDPSAISFLKEVT